MLKEDITQAVTCALKEDLGGTLDPAADLTSQLIPADKQAEAAVITREGGIFCGRAWAEEVFRQIGADKIECSFLIEDGQKLKPGQEVLHLKGNARLILTAERTALNFLQTLSGIATAAHAYAQAMAGTACTLLDTRKTIPGLRSASKYAVACGGGHNHRQGLFDMYLIKENHILACGGIAAAVAQARRLNPNAKVELEVRSLDELKQGLTAQPDVILLDNFEYEGIEQAVELTAHQVKLEISGNMTLDTIARFASLGVDYISVGALTKNIRALDFSLRLLPDADAAGSKPAVQPAAPAAAGKVEIIDKKDSVL